AAVDRVLEVGHQHVVGGPEAEEVVHVDVGRGVVLRGALGHQRHHALDTARAAARLVVTPVPSRRNQVSSVKLVRPRPAAGPNVTWSSVPSKSSALPGPDAAGVAVAW